MSLVVDDGLFSLALWGSVLLDGRLFDGVGWCMLVSLWSVKGGGFGLCVDGSDDVPCWKTVEWMV